MGRMAGSVAGFLLGALIWLLSPALTGRVEPWDAESLYYPLALLVSGFVAGWLGRDRWPLAGAAVFGGEAAVFLGRVALHPADGGLWPLGLMFLAGYALLAMAGAGIAGLFRRRLTTQSNR